MASAKLRTPEPAIPIKGKRKLPVVMLVDDDAIILRSLGLALSGRYHVLTCTKAVTSVMEIRKYEPDIILLDIRMPEQDGFWVYSEVRKFNPDVPIIFNSAYQDKLAENDVQGVYAPFASLPKSGRLDDILETFERAIASIAWQPG